jgi:hypothetical protein
VPLIEFNPVTLRGEPSPFVRLWGPGNWSGSANRELKTPRTAACLVEKDGRRFLLFSYFSTHTPNGVTRVMQSYRCKYAIHLDMNSPRFAYTALFNQLPNGEFSIEHLSTQMASEDVKVGGKKTPRSLLVPTYKDFFHVMRRN